MKAWLIQFILHFPVKKVSYSLCLNPFNHVASS